MSDEWRVVDDGGNPPQYGVTRPYKYGSLYIFIGTSDDDKEAAHLMAAAPNLLAALKASVAYPSSGAARRQAQAAIDKATGADTE